MRLSLMCGLAAVAVGLSACGGGGRESTKVRDIECVAALTTASRQAGEAGSLQTMNAYFIGRLQATSHTWSAELGEKYLKPVTLEETVNIARSCAEIAGAELADGLGAAAEHVQSAGEDH